MRSGRSCGAPGCGLDVGDSWTRLLHCSTQLDDQQIQLLNLPTDRLRDLHPQRREDVAIPICILALQGQLRSHTTRVDDTQQPRDFAKLRYQLSVRVPKSP